MRLSSSPGAGAGHNRWCPLVVQARAAYLPEHLRHIWRTPRLGPREFLDWAPAFPVWATVFLDWARVASPIGHGWHHRLGTGGVTARWRAGQPLGPVGPGGLRAAAPT